MGVAPPTHPVKIRARWFQELARHPPDSAISRVAQHGARASSANSGNRRHQQQFALAAIVFKARTRWVKILPFAHPHHARTNLLSRLLPVGTFLSEVLATR
jgi:hypothetical protein